MSWLVLLGPWYSTLVKTLKVPWAQWMLLIHWRWGEMCPNAAWLPGPAQHTTLLPYILYLFAPLPIWLHQARWPVPSTLCHPCYLLNFQMNCWSLKKLKFELKPLLSDMKADKSGCTVTCYYTWLIICRLGSKSKGFRLSLKFSPCWLSP